MSASSHLKSLQALELALRAGSLKGAADVLGISPAAVGQRVKALEDYLGVDLVVRGRTGLQPAPALTGALPHLSAAFRELDAASEALNMQRAQEIHVAALSDFAELWLETRLARFRAAHPNVRFCVNGVGEAPLRLGAVDCEIGFGPSRPETTRLFADYVLPLASTENTARIGRLPQKHPLQGFPLLHLDFYKDDDAVPDWRAWTAAHGLEREAPDRGIRYQRIAPTLDAVRADAGLALCGVALLGHPVEACGLSLPFGVESGAWTSHAFQARFRVEALSRPQIRHFRDWLLQESAQTSASLERYATGQL